MAVHDYFRGRDTMRRLISKWIVPAIVVGGLVACGQSARADGYYYEARSLYVMPPMYAYQPIFAPQPIVVYEPVAVRPAPVAGYVVPIAAPAPRIAMPVVAAPAPAISVGVPARVIERQVVTPYQSRTRYHVYSPYGPDYTYRVRDNGYSVRFSERWSR
jgi:hypothetical protein